VTTDALFNFAGLVKAVEDNNARLAESVRSAQPSDALEMTDALYRAVHHAVVHADR
jgi:hypothetical protein